ncbi:hypothetical protein [Hymenobacter crusticola]|uniref:Uncharacterized protein n=1 Tax=Hymenobacter crusticola TaxID=1770526 RepID=A0A243W5K2_9BACT|nr:hypothetical protein [Hymenobacter crusticola]OUJ68001.1 hypothetical protein BXP70_28290 [Hymenobacter crusticola]
MAKQKINLDHLANKPAASMDELLLGASATPTVQNATLESPAEIPDASAKIRFTNALPPETFLRLQQYTFWSHETIGDVLNEAILAHLEGKPEADKTIPAKQAQRRRLPTV